MTADAVLSVENLCKAFGSLQAVDGVRFHVAPGEIVGLVGPNGAGKTTTINMILGVLAPTSGRIEIDGVSLAANRSRALARTNFAAVYAPLPGNLTVEQNLRVFGMIYAVEGFPSGSSSCWRPTTSPATARPRPACCRRASRPGWAWPRRC